MKVLIISFISGIVFALGLGVSGMTWPSKVVGFLDLFGAWDPSLMFVMVGAICVYSVGYRLIMRRSSPLFGKEFHLPTRKQIDRKLMLGSTFFGVGWGLVGYCPGPALTSLVGGQTQTWIFVAAMVAGMWAFSQWEKRNG